MVTLTKSRMSNSCILSSRDTEGSSRSSRPHYFSSSLSRGSFSWSFVMRIALLSASQNSDSSSTSGGYCPSDYVYGSNNESSFPSSRCEGSKSSSFSRSFFSRPGARRKSCRKPVLLEKVPFGKSAKYMIVYVGPSPEQTVKYVISRRLLTHPLLQVLLKCSEDEFGEGYAVNKGVAIVCDPALFVELVRAIDSNLWSA